MFALRTTRAAARIVPRQTSRRFASTEHHTPDPHHHHHGPSEEKLGKGFFISVASLIGIMAFFKAEQATARTDRSMFTRFIDKYTDSQDLWAEKAHRHTARVEQAGRDRSLFMDTGSTGVIPLKSIEILNSGSPFNNQAGWAGGNMVELKRKLEGKYQA